MMALSHLPALFDQSAQQAAGEALRNFPRDADADFTARDRVDVAQQPSQAIE